MANQFPEYTIGAIDLGGTILHGTDNYSENPGVALLRRSSAGRPHPSYSAVLINRPTFTFQSPEVNRILNTAGVWATANNFGLEIATPVVIYYTRKNALKRSTGADHPTVTINEGIIYPTALAWSGDDWLLDISIMAYSEDGTTLPFVYGTASLPTLAKVSETFTGGRVEFNTVEEDCWQDVSLDFGVEAHHQEHKGLEFPVGAIIDDFAPSATVRKRNLTAKTTYGFYGTRLTGFELHLRKNMTTAGQTPTRELDASLVHVRFDATDGIGHLEETTAGVDGAEQAIRYEFDEDAANAIMVPNYGVAIS